jgi:ribosomal protein S18 acetylase RimI-like enzyme
MNLISVLLNKSHKKLSFRCGKIPLDYYIQKLAKQDIKRSLAACYVIEDRNIIAGYYTLSSNSIPYTECPEDLVKKLPKGYVDLPTILLGRLAVDSNYQGTGLGEILLIDALKRCVELSNSVAAFAIIVNPLDEDAQAFYEKYGFIMISGTNKMILPIATAKQFYDK